MSASSHGTHRHARRHYCRRTCGTFAPRPAAGSPRRDPEKLSTRACTSRNRSATQPHSRATVHDVPPHGFANTSCGRTGTLARLARTGCHHRAGHGTLPQVQMSADHLGYGADRHAFVGNRVQRRSRRRPPSASRTCPRRRSGARVPTVEPVADVAGDGLGASGAGLGRTRNFRRRAPWASRRTGIGSCQAAARYLSSVMRGGQDPDDSRRTGPRIYQWRPGQSNYQYCIRPAAAAVSADNAHWVVGRCI